MSLVEQYGPKRWSVIALHLPGRIGKQCRERQVLLYYTVLHCRFLLYHKALAVHADIDYRVYGEKEK